MSAPWLMVFASFLFASMGVCVKLASAHYGTGEIVFYRGLIGVVVMWLHAARQGRTMRTPVPAMHFWRSLSGVTALCLWFYSIGKLPIATAVTLNYSSSVWMALFLVGGSVAFGSQRVEPRLIMTVLLGFAGVAFILRPTIEENQLWNGLIGLLSGMIAAAAYLQVGGLGRVGEPSYRIVFYFSVAGLVAGAILTMGFGWHAHTLIGVLWLVLVGLLATVAQLMMTRAYAIGRPLVNGSLQYLGIAFSYGWGVLLFDDHVTLLAIVGMLFIVVAGILATQLRSSQATSPMTTLPPES